MSLWTVTRWKDAAALAAAMRQKANARQDVVLSPMTAMVIAEIIDPARRQSENRPGLSHLDPHRQGSAIYLLTDKREIEQIAAWARNTIIGRAAFDALAAQYPDRIFEMRRGAWVEAKSDDPLRKRG